MTPTQLNFQSRALLERNLGRVSVQGELFDFKGPRSGHWYFGLKDGRASVRAVMFASDNARVRFEPREGMLVTIHGRVTIYEASGSFQVQASGMEPAGEGVQAAAFEALKRKLEKEGLFDPARKKLLPAHPRSVGVVTSPQAAALQDILKVLQRRAPHVHVLLAPARVQGQGAAAELRHAVLQLAQSGRVEVIILGRGGGSAEDLNAFNDEALARAVAACGVPVVSAVGHETDRTILDFVADRYASTPSAAAALVTPSREETLKRLEGLLQRLHQTVDGRLQGARLRLLRAQQRIPSARHVLMDRQQQLDELETRARRAVVARIKHARGGLAGVQGRLSGAHPAVQVRARRAALARAQGALLAASPARRLKAAAHAHHTLSQRGHNAMATRLREARQRLAQSTARLDALSPLAVLTRGYALVRRAGDGAVVRTPGDAPAGTTLSIKLRDGAVRAQSLGPDHGEDP